MRPLYQSLERVPEDRERVIGIHFIDAYFPAGKYSFQRAPLSSIRSMPLAHRFFDDIQRFMERLRGSLRRTGSAAELGVLEEDAYLTLREFTTQTTSPDPRSVEGIIYRLSSRFSRSPGVERWERSVTLALGEELAGALAAGNRKYAALGNVDRQPLDDLLTEFYALFDAFDNLR